MCKQVDSSNKQNEWLFLSKTFTAKYEFFFCLNTGKHFVVEISF